MAHETNSAHDGLYIQLFSPHGLIRFRDPEIGKDKDTGGQVKYRYFLSLLPNELAHLYHAS